MSNILFILLYNILFPFNHSGEKYFLEIIDKYKLIYSQPEGYKFSKSFTNTLELGEGLNFANLSFIKSKDKNVLIGFYFQELSALQKGETSSPSHFIVERIRRMDVYRYNMKLSKETLQIHSNDKTSILNANISGEFDIKRQKPFLGRYSNCSTIFFERFDQLSVFIFYLYQSDNEAEANNLMKETFDILTFDKK